MCRAEILSLGRVVSEAALDAFCAFVLEPRAFEHPISNVVALCRGWVQQRAPHDREELLHEDDRKTYCDLERQVAQKKSERHEFAQEYREYKEQVHSQAQGGASGPSKGKGRGQARQARPKMPPSRPRALLVAGHANWQDESVLQACCPTQQHRLYFDPINRRC